MRPIPEPGRQLLNFPDRLEAAWSAAGTALCVGVEPRPDATPACFGAGLDAARHWGEALIDSAGPQAAAFKFQIAHFSRPYATSDI